MEDLWLTYAEAGQRLGVSAESIRAKAIRRGWRRQSGNDGRTRVLLPLNVSEGVEQPVNARSPHVRRSVDPTLVNALESHIKTLQGDIEALKEQLRVQADKAEKLASDLAARDALGATELAAERARTDRALSEFAVLADRIAALAEQRARPWWRTLLRVS
jgi:hypothetical protein